MNRDYYGKIENITFVHPAKVPIDRIFIHLDTSPRRRKEYA